MSVGRGVEVPVEVVMVEKRGQCEYELGHTFEWKGWAPPGMCGALIQSIMIPAIMCSLGAPSWETDERVWLISCPSKKGTVWRLEAKSGADKG